MKSLILAVMVTAYVPGGNLEYLGEPVVPGWTCAVSPDMTHLMGKWFCLRDGGWRYVNDLTSRRLRRHIDDPSPNRKLAFGFGKQKDVVLACSELPEGQF